MALAPTGVGFGLKPAALVFHSIKTGCVGFKLDSGPAKQNAEQFASASHAAFASTNVALAFGWASLCELQPKPPWQQSPPFSVYASPL
eukprot:345528-Prymnesium_polylepis.1